MATLTSPCSHDLNLVICTHNRAEKLCSLLRSLDQADLPDRVRVEIIVVDNNSSDSTRGVVNEIAMRSRFDYRYLFEPRPGKSHALNTALDHLSGEIVAFTDDDVTIEPDFFAEILAAAARNPECACFGGKIAVRYPETLPDWLNLDGPLRFVRSVFYERQDGDQEGWYDELGASLTPGGGNMFFRRSVLLENGPFRTDLGPKGKDLGFSEDTEYCLRAMERGFRFRYIPSVVIHHPIDPDRLSVSYITAWQYECGRSEAMRHATPSYPTLFGIPRFLFRKALGHGIRWLFTSDPEQRLYHRLRLAFNLGQIAGYGQAWFRRLRRRVS